jgi:hypothetical protein
MQNQPDPDTPVHERRWLDRLRAAWDDARAGPASKDRAETLEAVARERREEAKYRIGTFAADAAHRTSPTPAGPTEAHVQHGRGEPEGRGGQATAESDRFDDEAGR